MLKVLLPLDGSSSSQYGVCHVVSEFMKNQNMEIHVLNVQAPFSRHVARYTSKRARKAFHLEEAEKALAPALKVLDRSGIPYTVHTEVGNKADCIADAGSRLHCDRIVMSTARKSSLVRLVQNSVTNQVIERTTVPVEVIAGDTAPSLERMGIPAGVGAGLLLLGMAVD